MISVDKQFINRLSLEGLKKSGDKYNFRCPLCGDSKISKSKKRGNLYPDKNGKDTLYFYCFNCNQAGQFFYFMKLLKDRGFIDEELLTEYRNSVKKIKFDSKQPAFFLTSDEIIKKEEKVQKNFTLCENDLLQNINSIKCKSVTDYLEKRHIKKELWDDIYVTTNYKKLINNYYLPGKYKSENDTPRIVFPLYFKGELIGLQGRAIDKDEKVRYLTIKLKEESTLCYIRKNLLYKNSTVYLTEGIFDALMLRNGIAMLSSKLDLNFVQNEFNKSVFVFDNEPRNTQILNNYKNIASLNGIGLFIWPRNIKQKDLNDLRNSMSFDEIQELIDKNTYYDSIIKKINLEKWSNI